MGQVDLVVREVPGSQEDLAVLHHPVPRVGLGDPEHPGDPEDPEDHVGPFHRAVQRALGLPEVLGVLECPDHPYHLYLHEDLVDPGDPVSPVDPVVQEDPSHREARLGKHVLARVVDGDWV